MRRSPVFRRGLAVLAATLCAVGLAAPAHADPGTGTLTGRLSNHAGKPVTTVSVSVYDRDTYEVLASTETDLDGRFAVQNLAAGDVKVQFTGPGSERWAGGAASYDEAKVFTITAGNTTVIDEKLPAPALEGRLTNHADEPAADAKITVYDDEDYEVLDSATTDADGHFEVASLPPGKVKVHVRLPRLPPVGRRRRGL